METLRKCEKCGNFFDTKNINFLTNVALSEALEKETNEKMKDIYNKYCGIMSSHTKIQWCTCNTEEKQDLKDEALEFLVKKQVLNEDIEEESLGFDFRINKNILYFKHEQNFNDTVFLKFVKSLKTKLHNDHILSFDYIDYDIYKSKTFDYKKYYNTPNYLLIYDLENLKEDNADILVLLNNIIKQRSSNNKKTFILSSLKNEAEFKKFISARFFSADEVIYQQFLKLITDNFENMSISAMYDNDSIKINTIKSKETKKTKKDSQKVAQQSTKKEENIALEC